MSNAQQPKKDLLSPEGEQGSDEMKDALMGRSQEVEHVQSRFSNLQLPGDAPPEPGAGPSGRTGSHGTVSVHQEPKEKVGTFLPSTEGGAWNVAAALRLGAAGFGLMTAVLFVLPELTRSFQEQRPVAEAAIQTTYKTIAPVLDTPAPSVDPEEAITEQAASFEGAAILVVEAEPASASVRVDGNDQGNTPVSLTLDCIPGKPIKVEVTRKGFERAQHVTFCRLNTMIKLYARLRKAEKAPGAPK
ncbi:MAG: PEGA domain-containing protein [Hyalangium sp.]|uniref:PEGA domain-containing protein n=1 Tax=Hyalangium sp. TaxID=2028555 RepID=UPI003899C967